MAPIIDDNRAHSRCRRRLAPERAQTSYRTRKTGETLSRMSGSRVSFSRGSRTHGSGRRRWWRTPPRTKGARWRRRLCCGWENGVPGDDASTSGLVKQLFDASIRRRVSLSLLSECRSRARRIGVDFRRK